MAGETLGSIADIVMGQSPQGEVVTAEPVGLPLLNGPTEFGTHHPTPVQFTTDVRKKARPGDILFCVRGSTTGRMNWADRDYAIGRGIAAIRHKTDKRIQPFVRAVIENGLPDLLIQATGTTFPNVSASQLASIPYPSIHIDDQCTIAHILGTFDDKIELNRCMNETLEAIARALFKSWFMDFDPVRAKMSGEPPESICQRLGLTPDHLALFPDRLVDSELGEIPEGWVVSCLANHMDIAGGTQPPANQFISEPQEGYIRLIQIRDYETDAHLTYVKKTTKLRITTRQDIMIARYGASVGRICWGLEGAYNVALVRVVCEEVFREFLRSYLMSGIFQARLLAMSGRSAQSGFNKGDIASFSIVVPPKNLLAKYQEVAWSLRIKILHNRDQVNLIGQTRDTLLPKLLSGELNLSDSFDIVK